jgi:purine catabolism regulator
VIGAVRQLPAKAYYQVADVGLQGLVYLLRDDERLQRFRDRELGPLMAFDARHGSDLLRVLRTFLGQGGNKAGTATELGLSRPTLYARLAQIAAILKVDLDLAESRLSLHVASLALDATQLESMFPRAWGPSARVVP